MFAFWFLLHWLILFLIPTHAICLIYLFIFHLSPTQHTHTSTYAHSFIHLARRTKAHFMHLCLALCIAFIHLLVHSTNTNHTDTNSEFYRFVFSFMVFAYFFSLLFLLVEFYFVLFCIVRLCFVLFCSVCAFSVFFKVFGVMEFFVVVDIVLCCYVS